MIIKCDASQVVMEYSWDDTTQTGRDNMAWSASLYTDFKSQRVDHQMPEYV